MTAEPTAGAGAPRGPGAAPIELATLANGVRIAFEPMPWLPTASYAVLLPLGAATDPEGLEGAAGVLLEWSQRGAGALDSRAYSDALDELGVRRSFGAGREMSSLRGSLLVDVLPEALELVARSLAEPRLDAAQFEPARALAREELAALDDSPNQRLFEALRDRFFTSPQGRSVYGTPDGLAALDAETLRRDAAERLGPEGAVVAVAGGCRWSEVLAAVERAFGGWRGATRRLPEPAVGAPFRDHLEAPAKQVQIGFAFESVAADHPDWYAQALAMAVLSGGMGSRLFTEVREKRGLVYSVAAVTRALRGFGYTLGYAGTTPERADETLEVVLAEIERLGVGVEAGELERARSGLVSDLVMQGESSGARAAALAQDLYLRGAPRTLDSVREALHATDLDRVNGWLAERPAPRPSVLTLGPVPGGADAAAGARAGTGA